VIWVQQFTNGAVVVSEYDIAEPPRKDPDFVITALNVLLKEQKIQRMPFAGYWPLNAGTGSRN